MTETTSDPLAERVAVLESRQRDTATLAGWMTRVEFLDQELKHQAARLETLFDNLKEHVTGRVSKLDAELRGRVVQAEETTASFADRTASFAEQQRDTNQRIDELRAELRSTNPQTPGMLQMVPGMYKKIEELDACMKDVAKRLLPGLERADADRASDAADAWAKTPVEPDGSELRRQLWPLRKDAFIEGYKQARKDADEQAKRCMVKR